MISISSIVLFGAFVICIVVGAIIAIGIINNL